MKFYFLTIILLMVTLSLNCQAAIATPDSTILNCYTPEKNRVELNIIKTEIPKFRQKANNELFNGVRIFYQLTITERLIDLILEYNNAELKFWMHLKLKLPLRTRNFML
jgi:hypothetical protein